MTARLEPYLAAWLGSERAYAVCRLLSYLSVSATALTVDVTVYRLLLPMLPAAALAAACGFLSGAATHYWISSRFVFSDVLTKRGGAEEAAVFARFVVAGSTGMIVTSLIVWLLADIGGYDPLLAKACAVAFSFVSVLTAMRLLVLGDFLKRSAA